MNLLDHEPFADDYGDVEKISSFPGESGTRITQSDATVVVTNHNSGTKPTTLISTVQRQKEKGVESKNDGSVVPCLYDASTTELVNAISLEMI